jgi:hypothetical protein
MWFRLNNQIGNKIYLRGQKVLKIGRGIGSDRRHLYDKTNLFFRVVAYQQACQRQEK